eukprot:SAG11_NODE_34027_length_274_cov_0.594286_1_plen_20_part_10
MGHYMCTLSDLVGKVLMSGL